MRYDLAAIKQFNIGVARARADYERMPNRACMAKGCFNLHDDDRGMCEFHSREWRKAADRMRAQRARDRRAAS